MLAALASALAARDPSTAAHCSRVTWMACRLATWIGWDDGKLRALKLGGPVHDIGKVMIAESILTKRGPLHPDELAVIRTHPAVGARLIGPAWPAEEALPYVLYHHERWDGSGYPAGLRGTEIPEEARLLAIVDAFDAMTSFRPYRRPLPIWRALAEIDRCAGTQFDPTLATSFLDAWEADVLRPAAVG